jgi:hypothetical protein
MTMVVWRHSVNKARPNLGTGLASHYTEKELVWLEEHIERFRQERNLSETETKYIMAEVPKKDKQWKPPQRVLQKELFQQLSQVLPWRTFISVKRTTQRHLLRGRKKIDPEILTWIDTNYPELVSVHDWRGIKAKLVECPYLTEDEALATMTMDLSMAFAKGIPFDISSDNSSKGPLGNPPNEPPS